MSALNYRETDVMESASRQDWLDRHEWFRSARGRLLVVDSQRR
jgi:hypothetical protein